MPAQDVYHNAVKQALIKDGWTITADPLRIGYGDVNVFVDLGAEKPIAAEKAGRKIAVEVKSFIGRSIVRDMEQALGQYVLYQSLLTDAEPDRTLYLAVDSEVYESIILRTGFQRAISRNRMRMLVVHMDVEEIFQWIE